MHGLYLLWWVQEKQMSPALVAAVLAAGDLALMGIELPTGWFADRFGHRTSLIMGSLVQVIGMLWCWLGDGVTGLITASILIALGDGFRSGADQALLYRTCVALECEEEFQKIHARTEAVALGALVVLVLIGGVIVHTSGFALGWVAETLLCFCGLMIACAMVDPPADSDRTFAQNATTDRSSLGLPYGSSQATRVSEYRRLAMTIMPAALLSGVASAASFLAQTTGVNTPVTLTMLVAMLTAAEAGGCALASRLPPAKARDQISLIAIAALLMVSAMVRPALLPLVALALALLMGVVQPLRAAAIQRLASDDMRARAASAASACDMAVSTIVLPLAGIWRTRRRIWI